MSTDMKFRAEQVSRNHLAYTSTGRITEWIELFSDNAVLEFPDAPKGFPQKIEGRGN